VISAQLRTPDNAGDPLPIQYGVETLWGDVLVPQYGANMAVFSTGSARMPSQSGFFAPRPATIDPAFKNTGNSSVAPTGWPHNVMGCPSPPSDKSRAYDPVVLTLVVRVPTNANAFSFDYDFFSSEYLNYVCSQYNDTFVALLQSKIPVAAANFGNVAADSSGDPINVNSGFFEVCTPGTAMDGRMFACSKGIAELAGTGFDKDTPNDGATGWLRSTASVSPGEEITIDFMLWNTADHNLQSTVLLDNWSWAAHGSPGTGRPH
jgi:hypothetical protein